MVLPFRQVVLAGAVVVLIAVLSWTGCASPETMEWSTSGSYAPWSPEAKFVGIEACAACHTPQHDSFIRSQMGRSFKHATRELSDAEWDNVEPIYSAFDDMYYLPFSRGSDLFVREYRLSGRDTLHNRVEQIDYIVGSGQHTNSHIYSENGFLYQIPVTWYAQDKKWGLAPKFQKAGNNYRFGRVITDECMACHNAQPTFVAGSENRFESVPEGINCEKCHGPGSIHIEEKTAGIIVDTNVDIDFSIVNPGKLSPELQLDVCKRCHMQGASVFADGQTPLDWRPGKPLSTHQNVFWPRQPDSTTHFIMASHPDRLAMSSCFLESWKEDRGFEPITCLTCHDPHKPIDELEPGGLDAACVNCHESAPDRITSSLTCTEPSVVNGTSEATCASCHMPQSGSTDIPYIRITDHHIRVPEKLSKREVDDQTRFIRLAALIDPLPGDHEKADGYLTYFEQFTDRPGMLDSASVHLSRAEKAGKKDLIKSWIRLWHLQDDHASVRRAASSSETIPEDAWTHYRIGAAYAAIEQYPAAIRWYEKALALGPDHLRFMDKLGVAYTQAGRYQEALDTYDRLVQLNPLFENGLNNRGFARLMTQDLEGAESDFRAALALAPDMELAGANLASLLINTNRVEAAKPLVRKLIKDHPSNQEYARVWDLISGL